MSDFFKKLLIAILVLIGLSAPSILPRLGKVAVKSSDELVHVAGKQADEFIETTNHSKVEPLKAADEIEKTNDTKDPEVLKALESTPDLLQLIEDHNTEDKDSREH